MNRELNEKQRKAIYLLLHKNYSKSETADAVGVSTSTVYAWISRNRLFKEAYREEEDILRAERIKEYKLKAEKAVEKLMELLNCGNERIELSAAKEIIGIAENKIRMYEDSGSAEFNVNIVIENGGNKEENPKERGDKQ